jgi:hypothetical protein
VAVIQRQTESSRNSRKAIQTKSFFTHMRGIWRLSGPEPAEGMEGYGAPMQTEEERQG